MDIKNQDIEYIDAEIVNEEPNANLATRLDGACSRLREKAEDSERRRNPVKGGTIFQIAKPN